MNCKLAEQNLALWVGGDLDETSVRELEEHLALCSHCRAAGRRLKTAQRVLVKASHVETVRPVKSTKSRPTDPIQIQTLRAPDDSIWPNVARGLRALEARKRKQRFNGWIPAAAVIAACLAIILSPRPAVYNLPQSHESTSGTAADMGGPVLFDRNGLIIDGEAMRYIGTEQYRFPHDQRPARSGNVNSSMGKLSPGLQILLDERPLKK